MQDDQDVIREFLVESHENLSRLDQDLIELELHPKDSCRLASIFRTIHTIKGTCGFFAFSTLEKITHQAETLLSQLRDGKRELNPALISLILETVDATRKVLASIEASGKEGPDVYEDLTERLRVEAQSREGSERANSTRPGVRLPRLSASGNEYRSNSLRTVRLVRHHAVEPRRKVEEDGVNGLPPLPMPISGSESGCWTS